MASTSKFKRSEARAQTTTSLNEKLAELFQRLKNTKEQDEAEEAADQKNPTDETNRKNEKENVRGFTEGGSSEDVIEDNAKDLAAQIAMIQAELDQQKKLMEVEQMQEAIDDIIQNARENGLIEDQNEDEKGGHYISCESIEDAKKIAKAIVAQYSSLGFECDVSESKNVITVTVKMPEKFKDRNPMQMSAEELLEARELNSAEKSTQEPETKDKKSSSWVERTGSQPLVIIEGGSWANKVINSAQKSSSPEISI